MAVVDDDLQEAREELQKLSTAEESERRCAELLQEARQLLDELEQFRLYIASNRQAKPVELRHFKTAVESELRTLEKHSKDLGSEKTAHALRSSNFQFYSSVWATAKLSTGIIGMKKRFYWLPGEPNGEESLVNRTYGKGPDGSRDKQHSADVDIVAREGHEWIKISTITSKRVLWDLAKQGWVDDSSDEEDADLAWMDDDEAEGVVKQAQALTKAARATRIGYRHPKIRMVFTRISRGKLKEVDAVIRKVESLGITVQTADQIVSPPIFNHETRELMAANPFHSFSDILNVDCTLLLAFVSDLSNSDDFEERDSSLEYIRKQMEIEREDHLLPNTLWPACGSRKLTCASFAAQRMFEIVDLIGTETEKKRMRLLMDKGEKHLTREERIAAFQKLSIHKVPDSWQLPIEAVTVDIEEMRKVVPADPDLVEEVINVNLPINQSIFIYGWATGITTISSNGAVTKKIETTIEEHRKTDDDRGPHIWLCSTSRSLLAKEKERRGYHKQDI